jgi:hypothetical protein
MDRDLRKRLETFLLPYYQDLDGVSRMGDVERIAAIARRLYAPPSPADARSFELLLLFHRLGRWLEKVGNLTRVTLGVSGVSEQDLRATAASIRNLEHPHSAAECAVAAAVLLDGSGVRGLVEQFTRSRREGASMMDVMRQALADISVPAWLPPQAVEWLHARREARRELCRRLIEETSLDDLAAG